MIKKPISYPFSAFPDSKLPTVVKKIMKPKKVKTKKANPKYKIIRFLSTNK